MGVRLTINVDIAVDDKDALRGFVWDSTQARLKAIGAPADFTKRRLEAVRKADDQAIVVMAVRISEQTLSDVQEVIARVPGLRCHGASTSATPNWPDREDL